MVEAISPMAFLRDFKVLVIVDPIDGSMTMAPDKTFAFDSGQSELTLPGNIFIRNGNGLVVGHTSRITSSVTPELQVLGTAADDSAMLLGLFIASGAAPQVNFVKSRNAIIGSNTVVQDGDRLGDLLFFGDDGVDYASIAARIDAFVDGVPGVGDMPGRLVFSTTADGAEVPTERMRLTAAGVMRMTGNIVPEADGTRDLGVQTTAQWANLWSDLVNGADYGFDNGWRALESDVFQGYGPGIAFASGDYFETGKALGVKHVKVGERDEDVLDDEGNVVGTKTIDVMERQQVRDVAEKPIFAVTDDFIEYQGRRITPEILDKLLALV